MHSIEKEFWSWIGGSGPWESVDPGACRVSSQVCFLSSSRFLSLDRSLCPAVPRCRALWRHHLGTWPRSKCSNRPLHYPSLRTPCWPGHWMGFGIPVGLLGNLMSMSMHYWSTRTRGGRRERWSMDCGGTMYPYYSPCLLFWCRQQLYASFSPKNTKAMKKGSPDEDQERWQNEEMW